MAWVGLSDGPYGRWRSPRGRTIQVNFGEHTVVLKGIRADGSIRVVNPLEGTRELVAQRFRDDVGAIGRPGARSVIALLGIRFLSAAILAGAAVALTIGIPTERRTQSVVHPHDACANTRRLTPGAHERPLGPLIVT